MVSAPSAAAANTTHSGTKPKQVAIIGAGPAGLFAAECLAAAGQRVTIYERMPSPARKFLMAGRGGLNLTHSEPLETFLSRHVEEGTLIRDAVSVLPPSAIIAWANGLGIETFTGSSGRVFPKQMKASPLLRAWLKRLAEAGVTINLRHTWRGFTTEGRAIVAGPLNEEHEIEADAVLLAVGGASWPKLGSDGAFAAILTQRGVAVAPLSPSNCGIEIVWSEIFRNKFQGTPLKRIAATAGDTTRRGEAMITARGLEGGVVYALSHALRSDLARCASTITIDLRPDMAGDELARRLLSGPKKDSLSNRLRKAAGLSPAASSLLREAGPPPREAEELARRIKSVSLQVTGLSGLERAISTAGGVMQAAVDDRLMLRAMPGVFVAGEMLDFDAPTGGYLLQAAFATGARVAEGIQQWLAAETAPGHSTTAAKGP